MKAAPFDYLRPSSVSEALEQLGSADGYAKVLAGGQSLGPMMNLRLAQPDVLIDISRVPALRDVQAEGASVTIGACVTHAAIEDGAVTGRAGTLLRSIATGIAYRAVRNRGTIGGSLAHADPAADWVVCLTALGARALIEGPKGRRAVEAEQFFVGPYQTAIEENEILCAVELPVPGAQACFGYYKYCRKTGEFAETMAAVLSDPASDKMRIVIGAAGTQPVVIPAVIGAELERGAVASQLETVGVTDAIDVRLHSIAAERAIAAMKPV